MLTISKTRAGNYRIDADGMRRDGMMEQGALMGTWYVAHGNPAAGEAYRCQELGLDTLAQHHAAEARLQAYRSRNVERVQ